MTGKEILKMMKKNGWVLDRIKGGHHIMIKEYQRSIPVPIHGNKDVPIGLAKAILKQAGIED